VEKTIIIVLQDLEDGGAVDFYHAGSLVCWTDHGKEMIACQPTNRTDGSHAKVLSLFLSPPTHQFKITLVRSRW